MADILQFPGPKARSRITSGLTDAQIVAGVNPSNGPHTQASLICVACHHQQRSVYPTATPLALLECAGCHLINVMRLWDNAALVDPASLCPVCTPQGLGPVCADCLRVAPMRAMVYRHCLNCDHRWIQPAKTGGCPTCHAYGDYVVNESETTNGLKRV